MYCEACGFWQAHTWIDETLIYHWLKSTKEIKFYRCNGCNKINDSSVVFV